MESRHRVLQYIRQSLRTQDILLLTGMSSVGKTTIVKHVLASSNCIYSFINCEKIATGSQLLNEICSQFLNQHSNNGIKRKYEDKIHGTSNFISFIQDYSMLPGLKSFDRMIVAFDKAEQLTSASLLDTFLFLHTYFLNIGIVCIANDFEFLQSIRSSGVISDIEARCDKIEIPPWSKEDVAQIIIQKSNINGTDILVDEFDRFVNNVVITHYNTTTKDLLELKSICHDEFGEYMTKENRKSILAPIHVKQDKKAPTKPNRTTDCSTLLFYVAAYIAAFTKPQHDKINFVREQRRKKSKTPKFNEDRHKPKQFTLERLTHIHRVLWAYVTIPHDDPLPEHTLRLINRMETIGIIRRVTGSDFDSLTRYKITPKLSLKFIQSIAECLEIPLDSFFGLP